MCEAAGRKRKTAHCLRVTCASSLFNAGVDRKLIHDRSGHRSDALMKYEKANEKVQTNTISVDSLQNYWYFYRESKHRYLERNF